MRLESPLKKTFLINDLVWIGFAALVCWGGLKLGFGSFHQPQAGFMPVLSGLVLGLLALIDLISGLDHPSIVRTGNGDAIAIKSLPLRWLAMTAPPPV